MPKTSKQEASETFEAEGFEGHYQELEGYTIGFESYSAEADLADLFKGLPDDACQCNHMGVVLSGKVVFTYTDGTQDVITAGEAYVTKARTHAEDLPGDRGDRVQQDRRVQPRRWRSSRRTWRPRTAERPPSSASARALRVLRARSARASP